MKKISLLLLCALSAPLPAQAKTGIECLVSLPDKCEKILGSRFSTAKESGGSGKKTVWITFIIEVNCKISKDSAGMREYGTFLASYDVEAAQGVQFYSILPDQIKFQNAAEKKAAASLFCYFSNP